MANNISPLIQNQVPEHTRESSPIFVAFMETYYRYAMQRNSALGLVNNHTPNIDIDYTEDEYVSKFYSMYGEHLPKNILLDKRNFIKLLNDIYSAKGTEKALKLIFLALFGEDVGVSYPGENILRTSDGIWECDSFFTMVILYGDIDITSKLTFGNIYGDYVVEPSKLEIISQDTIRVSFKSYVAIKLVDNQEIFSRLNGEIVFTGRLIKSPSKLLIQNPGTSWQRGQVIIIPGTDKNSIARITSVSETGGILNTEILDFGYIHTENQTTTISPYPNKPIGSVIDYSSVLVSINPNVYHHTIDIRDYTDGCYEAIVGISDGISVASYFLEDYVIGYNGQVVISSEFNQIIPVSIIDDSGLSVVDWLASRATLIYEFSNIVTMKGYYKNENGQLL